MSLTRLIIFRHGKAERHATSREDFDRILADRGRLEADETGRRLASAGFTVEAALVSAAQRTVETWEATKANFPGAAVDIQQTLYNADGATLWKAAQDSGAASAILVGHNPGMHQLALSLAESGAIHPRLLQTLREGFPTASAAVFEWENGKPACKALVIPRDAS